MEQNCRQCEDALCPVDEIIKALLAWREANGFIGMMVEVTITRIKPSLLQSRGRNTSRQEQYAKLLLGTIKCNSPGCLFCCFNTPSGKIAFVRHVRSEHHDQLIPPDSYECQLIGCTSFTPLNSQYSTMINRYIRSHIQTIEGTAAYEDYIRNVQHMNDGSIHDGERFPIICTVFDCRPSRKFHTTQEWLSFHLRWFHWRIWAAQRRRLVPQRFVDEEHEGHVLEDLDAPVELSTQNENPALDTMVNDLLTEDDGDNINEFTSS